MTRSRFLEALGDWKQAEGPLYQRLADALRAAIGRGDLAAGTRLPAERVLARLIDVSRTTVVMAYDSLVQEERLESRTGSGTRVRATGTGSFPLREGAAAVLGSRNFVFRGMVEHGGAGGIEFLAARFDGVPEVIDELWAEAREELGDPLRSHGYLPLGLPALREAIASYLGGSGLATRPEQVLVTNGAQQAISLVASLLVEPGDRVVLEDPTFLGAIDAFHSFGARLRGVPSGRDGVHVVALRHAIATASPRVVYLMPACHNPTGSVLPEPARAEVARIAAESNAVWIEDRTLAELTLDGEPPPPVAALAPGASFLTIGSLSKHFWGGLRVGWIRGPEPLVTQLARMRVVSDLSGSLLPQAVGVRALARSSELARMRRRQARAGLESMIRLLARHLPAWTWHRPAGGLSLWVRMPFGDASTFAVHARGHGVTIVPGVANSPEGNHADHIRLPFIAPADEMAEGISRLARAWAEYAPVHGAAPARFGVVV